MPELDICTGKNLYFESFFGVLFFRGGGGVDVRTFNRELLVSFTVLPATCRNTWGYWLWWRPWTMANPSENLGMQIYQQWYGISIIMPDGQNFLLLRCKIGNLLVDNLTYSHILIKVRWNQCPWRQVPLEFGAVHRKCTLFDPAAK